MANKTLKTLHPFLQENTTQTSSGGTVKSFSHDHGSGSVLCMVHGWPQSSYEWRHVVPEWKDKLSLFIVELPGYGFSSLPPKHDKRTVGNIIVEALQKVFGHDRPVIWCGHDRGGRIGHRLLVDNEPSQNIKAAILMDIVPTTEQWRAFANPAASVAYHHWPFLATATAPKLIEAMGPGVYAKSSLERAAGGNQAGAAKFKTDDAIEHYAAQFSIPQCIEGSCGDYAAGANEDVKEQGQDQKNGRKVTTPLMVIYSGTYLGRMHDVPAAWKDWIAEGCDVRMEAVPDGFGHYLPEECPDRVTKLVYEWIDAYAK